MKKEEDALSLSGRGGLIGNPPASRPAVATHTLDLLAIAKTGDVPAFWRAIKNHGEDLRLLFENDQPEFLAWRTEIKVACSKINVRDLDAMLKPSGESSDSATELADLAADRCMLWHDEDKNAYASYEVGGHREHWKVDSRGFQDWLSQLAYSEKHAAPSAEIVKSCSNALAGKAKFDGEQFTPSMRAARDEQGYWLDMGDDDWRAVLITADGWRMVAQPPIKFTRTKSTRALPEPIQGGTIEDLWTLVNIPEHERLLTLAWILECLRPHTPYVLLELTGEQGSAKSSAQRILRQFVDPSQVALRGRPKNVEDIFVGAANSHLLSFENLSGLSNDQSDALCTCSTGGGYAARQLYTNGEESVLKAHCPIVLNGISPVVLRPDLLDRTISVGLPTIEHRVTESEIQAKVDKAAPGIMGALLTLFSEALRILPTVTMDAADLPRMADFALLGEAVARVLGYSDGTFIDLYDQHRKTAVGRSLEASPVAAAMVAFVERGGSHNGTVKDLLGELNWDRPDHEKEDYWPRSPKGLADAIRRYAPALRQLGIVARVASDRRRDGIHCELAKAETEAVRVGLKPINEVYDVHKFTVGDVEEL